MPTLYSIKLLLARVSETICAHKRNTPTLRRKRCFWEYVALVQTVSVDASLVDKVSLYELYHSRSFNVIQGGVLSALVYGMCVTMLRGCRTAILLCSKDLGVAAARIVFALVHARILPLRTQLGRLKIPHCFVIASYRSRAG